MIGDYLASGLPILPPTNAELYIDVVRGDDATGQRNIREKPFKTFEAAFAAASEWDRIRIITQAYGGAGKINGTDSILIDKGILVELESNFNNKGPLFENCVVTINITTRRPVYFKSISFINTTLDDSCIKINSVSDHNVQFDDCYIVNYVNGGTGINKTVLEFSGQWLTSGTTGNASRAVIVLLNRCSFAGKIVCGAGTVGAPYDMKGTIILNDCTPRNHSYTTYATSIVVNSGAVIVQNNPRCPKITLNGGWLSVFNCKFPGLDGQNAINALATDTIGKSILILNNLNMMNYWHDPMTVAAADTGTITIGENVLYSINGLLIPAGNLIIDANAKEYHAYLTSQGKTTNMVVYNSMPTYTAGGEFYAYEKAIALAFNTANKYHAIHLVTASDIVAGDLKGFTFYAGRSVNSNITSEASGTGGKLRVICSVAHGLTTGAVVVLTNMNNAAHNAATKVTLDGTNPTTEFLCDNITYVSGAGASAGDVDEPAYLLAGIGTTGTYLVTLKIDGTCIAANKSIKFEVFVDVTEKDNTAIERLSTNTLGTMVSSAKITVLEGQRVWVAGENLTDTTDYTIRNMNLNLTRV